MAMASDGHFMKLLSAARQVYFEQYRKHYLGDMDFEEFIFRPPSCEAHKQLTRHHHRQVLADRVTYHMLRVASLSHEDTVEMMKAGSALSRPQKVKDVIRNARELATAILRTVGEPEPDCQDFSERTMTYFRAFLASGSGISFRDLDHYVNYFKAMMAAGIVQVRRTRNRNSAYIIVGDDAEAARIGNQLIDEEERTKGRAEDAGPSTSQETERPSASSSIGEEYECVVCMDGRPSVRTLPCKHMVVCGACFTELMKVNRTCPICRSAISSSLNCI